MSTTPTDYQIVPFCDYIQEGRYAYDYTGQRIILFNPQYKYAYIYSFKYKVWGMMDNSDLTFKSVLTSYPETYIVGENKILNCSKKSNRVPKYFVFTRPIKITPDNYKTITAVISRGNFNQHGDMAMILYGSRDMHNWHVVASSLDNRIIGQRGTPYKYYRIAFVGTGISEEQKIEGCTIQYENRQINRLK